MMRLRVLLLTTTAAVALALVPVTGASAAGPDPAGTDSTSTATGDPTGAGGASSSSGGSYTGTAGGCHVVSTANALGSYCPGAAQDTESIKKIMGGEKFKECWDQPMTAEDQAAYGYVENGDAKPYVRRCLRGIDPKSLAITGPIHIEEWPEWIYPGDTVVTIGPNQTQLLDFADHTIPYPVAGVSPATQPRVGQWVSFYDAQPDQMVGDGGTHQIVVNTLGVQLIAEEYRIVVQPRGMNIDDSVTCPGGGHRAAAGEQGVQGGNCWYRYQRSSAGQPDNTYPARVTAYWRVFQVVGGVRTRINEFQKSVTTQVPVTEIQAINVN